jgi:thymidylate kinase
MNQPQAYSAEKNMAGSLPLLPQRQAILLSEFLKVLLEAFDREKLRTCVLRNYQGFPDTNVGNDIDFLISPSDLPRAIRALRSLPGIRIVGYEERHYVANVFMEGISLATKASEIQIDFYLRLAWKGMQYLSSDAVLEAAVPYHAGSLSLFVPAPIHEAIISLFGSLLIGGRLKEKYFPSVQRIFADNSSMVITALAPHFGPKAATQLVDSVLSGDRRKIANCISPLRTALTLRSLLRRPVRSTVAIARHYTREFVLRYSVKSIESVRILGPDGCGKAKIIDALMPMLQSMAVVVERRPFKPRFSFGRSLRDKTADSASHAEAPGGDASMGMIVMWLVEEWLDLIFGKLNLKLCVCEGCYQDMLIDRRRYRYGGPMWFAHLVGRLYPSPDLWVLLDTPAETMVSRNQELPPAEAVRQLEAYRAFVKTRKRYVILDARQSIDCITENAYAAIIDTLAQRADRKLKRRF